MIIHYAIPSTFCYVGNLNNNIVGEEIMLMVIINNQ